MVCLVMEPASIHFFIRSKLEYFTLRRECSQQIHTNRKWWYKNIACRASSFKISLIMTHHWSVEVWAIASLLTFQEIPFLLSRLYFIFGLKVIKTQMMIFFTAKNFLTIAVYSYRIIFTFAHLCLQEGT